MSDREFGGIYDYGVMFLYLPNEKIGGSDDLSLPKATVSKIISEILVNDPGVTFSKESRDLLIDCCVEFITLVSSEANEIAEKDAKKTIACEHVTAALERLDYKEYIPEIQRVAQDYKMQLAVCDA
jgi:histone H3/H4